MDTEIELKLLVTPADLESLTNWMNQCGKVINHYQKDLGNNYFDTASRQLRSLGAGLRVRTIDGRSEQTLKTAGRVVGGLHQRPEYNVPIDGLRPDLFLFKRDIWPEEIDLVALQAALVPQFSTHFTRKTWLLNFNDEAIIEAVLDVGAVTTGEMSLPICEMELELVKGSSKVLFQFASQLSESFQIRLGQMSKAARGYRLMEGKTEQELQALPTLTIAQHETVESGLIKLVGAALHHLQTSEDVFFSNSSIAALQEVRHALLWLLQIRHYFVTDLAPESLDVLVTAKTWLTELKWVAQAHYRETILAEKEQYMKRLEDKKRIRKALKSKDQQQEIEQAKQLLLSTPYCQWLLQISQWLVCEGWRKEGESQPMLEKPITELAQAVLDNSKNYVAERFPADQVLTFDWYAEGCERLERALLSGNCFRRTFDPDATSGYRGPWHDMLKGCQELALLHYLEQEAEQLELSEPQSFERWLQRKRDSWVALIEQSKQSALAMPPYWH